MRTPSAAMRTPSNAMRTPSNEMVCPLNPKQTTDLVASTAPGRQQAWLEENVSGVGVSWGLQ